MILKPWMFSPAYLFTSTDVWVCTNQAKDVCLWCKYYCALASYIIIPYAQNYWWVKYLMICLKCYWQDFKLTVLSTVWEETYACSINGVHLIWQSLQEPPNRQNKHTINYYAYTVCLCESTSLHLTCYSVVSDLQLLMMAAEELEKLKVLYMTFTFISNCSHPSSHSQTNLHANYLSMFRL